MKKNGFTLVEIIVCIVLLAVIATTFIITTSKKETNTRKVTEVEKTILNATDVLINFDDDNNSNIYINQLNLGSQGVNIKLSKLVEKGLITEKVLDELYEQLKKSDNTLTREAINDYYILIVNGTFEDVSEEERCNGLSYYPSWEFDGNEKTLYLCGNLPGESAQKSSDVYITERSGLESYIWYYDDLFNVIDEDGNIITKNSDGKYTLNYGERYYIEFTEDVLYYTYQFELYNFNEDKNFVYLTLDNLPKSTGDTSYNEYVHYDLSNYFYYDKPQYSIDYLNNKIFENYFRSASELLNYNYSTPHAISYKTTYTDSDSIYIDADYRNYCYGTNYTYDAKARTFQLSGTITCKSYTASDTAINGKYTLRSTSQTSTSQNMYKITKQKSGDYYSGKVYSFTVDEVDDGYYYDYDDHGTTYFYRGDVKNNYVSFAGHLWRIIRKNGDGTFRIILEGDIGASKWNNLTSLDYYNGYTYGTVTYSPLITSSSSSERTDIDSTKSYCYSNSFTYDKSTNKYKLAGTITCKKLTSGTSEFYNMYTLFETSKTASSTKLRKMNYNYSGYRYYVYTYDTTATTTFSNYGSNYCYGTDYTIENGYYKLAGTIKCSIALSSSSNSSTYEDYYTVRSNSSTGTSTTMYQYTGKSGYWNYYAKVFSTPVAAYTASTSNQALVKQKLDEWYNSNLSMYDGFVVSSSFCNDTSKTTSGNSYYSSSTYNAYTRLAGSNKNPTFKCNGTFEYGGKQNLKIGLITADEMAFAGAAYNSANSNYYLAYNKAFWTMTPYNKGNMFTSSLYESSESYSGSTWYEDSNGYWEEVDTDAEWEGCSDGSLDCEYSGGYYHAAVNYNIFSNTALNSNQSNVYAYDGDASIVLRPVINLSSETIVYDDGDGTYGNPYVVDTNWEDLYYMYMMGWY